MERGREAGWEEYRGTYRRFSRRVERWLIQVAVGALLLLLLVQVVLVVPRGERLLSLAAFLEGEPAPAVTSWLGEAERRGEVAVSGGAGAPWAEPSITLQVEGGAKRPDLKLFVDGKAVGDLSTGSLTLAVTEGAALSVQRLTAAKSPTLLITRTAGVAQPKLGSRWLLSSEWTPLGAVRVAR
jgi:hypothetical protein